MDGVHVPTSRIWTSRIQSYLTDRNAIWRHFVSMRLYLAMLFIMLNNTLLAVTSHFCLTRGSKRSLVRDWSKRHLTVVCIDEIVLVGCHLSWCYFQNWERFTIIDTLNWVVNANTYSIKLALPVANLGCSCWWNRRRK